MKPAARIAVVRALHGLGDMLCAVPALSALRRAYPAAHIVLIGLPVCSWMLHRFSGLLDALMPFPGFPGIPEKNYLPSALADFLAHAATEPFDLAIQMHGNGTVSNAFTALLGSRATAGLYRAGHYHPVNGNFFPYPERGSEIHRLLYLTDSMSWPSEDDRLGFPISEADRARLRAHPVLGELPRGGFVCVHAGARQAPRRWPPERFARAADRLAEQGYRIVLTGTAAERRAAEAVASRMRRPAVNVAGETALGVAAALLERAALLITNDTGISHLAAAVRTPSVIVFLASEPDRWAPVDGRRHRPLVARALAAETGSARKSRSAVPEADEILDEAFELLNAEYGG